MKMKMKMKDPDCIIVAKKREWITLEFMMVDGKSVKVYLDKESAEIVRDEIKVALKAQKLYKNSTKD